MNRNFCVRTVRTVRSPTNQWVSAASRADANADAKHTVRGTVRMVVRRKPLIRNNKTDADGADANFPSARPTRVGAGQNSEILGARTGGPTTKTFSAISRIFFLTQEQTTMDDLKAREEIRAAMRSNVERLRLNLETFFQNSVEDLEAAGIEPAAIITSLFHVTLVRADKLVGAAKLAERLRGVAADLEAQRPQKIQ